MNVVFDKDVYEKAHGSQSSVDANDATKAIENADVNAGEPVLKALKDVLVTGKVGALSVDPNYLNFEALECKHYYYPFRIATILIIYSINLDTTNNVDDESPSDIQSFFQLSEVRLYTVFGIIAALLLVAIIQIICTVCKNRKTTRNQKVRTFKTTRS